MKGPYPSKAWLAALLKTHKPQAFSKVDASKQ